MSEDREWVECAAMGVSVVGVGGTRRSRQRARIRADEASLWQCIELISRAPWRRADALDLERGEASEEPADPHFIVALSPLIMSKTPSPSMPPPCSRRLPLDEITNVVAGLSSASYSSSALAPPTSSPAPPPPALVRPQAFDETPSPPTSSMPQTPRRSSRIASASVERASDGASSAGGPSRPGLILTPMRLDAQRRVKDAGADSLLLSASKRSVKKLRLSSGAPSPAAALSRAAEKRRMTVDDASDSSDDDYDGGRAMDVDDDLATPPRRLDFLNTADSDDRLKSFRLPLPHLGGRRAGRTTGVLGYLDARASGGGSRPGRRRMLGGGGLNSTCASFRPLATSSNAFLNRSAT